LVIHMEQLPNQNYSVFMGDGDTVVLREPLHVIIKRPETPYIGKEEIFIPQKADFGSKIPSGGKTYSLKLKRPVPEAALIYFSSKRAFTMTWEDAFGKRNQSDLTVVGSVILDKGADRLFFRMLSIAGKDRHARGVLINR
jgi:hypothetical protein